MSAIPPPPPASDPFVNDAEAAESGGDDSDSEGKKGDGKKAGRRKIKIEFIQDKSRRHITFSKRKAGIMKKAYELSTLTGTQVLLLVVSETGLVYTFTTAKLQPLVTQPEGKNLIQACLNAPHGTLPSSMPVGPPLGRPAPMGHTQHSNVPGGLSIGSGGKDDDADGDDSERPGAKRRRRSSTSQRPTRANPASSNPPQSPQQSPAQSGAPPISIPHQAGSGAQSQPPSALPVGPSPTSPSQTPTSPHYNHAGSGAGYHSGGSRQDMYGNQPSAGMMPPPPGPSGSYGFAQSGQSPASGHWTHGASAVQGGSYGRQ